MPNDDHSLCQKQNNTSSVRRIEGAFDAQIPIKSFGKFYENAHEMNMG